VPNEVLQSTVAAAGTWIDSVEQLDALCDAGVDPREVRFRCAAGPAEELRDAALRGVWRFACDSERELLKIAAAAPGSALYVVVNVGQPSDASLGNLCSASPDGALRLLLSAPECGLRPYGLSFRVDTPDRARLTLAIERCGLVMRRLEHFGIRLEMLEIGAAANSDPADLDALAVAFRRLPYRPRLVLTEP
jgi:ornithine decarboxylase